MGKLDTARAEIARLRRADSLSTVTMLAQYSLAAGLRDWNTIESQGQFWAAKPSLSERIRGLQYLRVGALARGHVSRFDSLSTQLSALLRAATAAGFLREETFRARAMVDVLGDAPRGRRIIDSALASLKWDSVDVLDRQYPLLIQTLAVVGDTTRALAYAAEWSRVTPAEFRMVDSLEVVSARGNVALAAGRPAEAIRLWHIADVRGCEACFMADYARAFDALKQNDSARVWYEKYLATYETSNTIGDAWSLPRAYRRLRELYEERREWDKAIKMYQELATVWENADPSLQPMVQDIKARIQRLRKLTG
jgi:tetratricopeptide (TPR) repeat protein